jgi:hypothetical protein
VEGKYAQVEKGTNNILIFNRKDKEDCLHAFFFSSEDKKSPYKPLNLDSKTIQLLLNSVPGLKLCDEDSINEIFEIPIKKSNRTIDFLKIEHPMISKSNTVTNHLKPGIVQMVSKRGGWNPLVEDDIASLSQSISIVNQNLKIVSGVSQVVSGINYILAVVPNDNDQSTPCLMAFNIKAWDPENKITELNSEIKGNGYKAEIFSGFSPCDGDLESQTITALNTNLVNFVSSSQQNAVNDLQVGVWNEIDSRAIPMMEKILNFKDFGLKFEKPPLIQNLMKIRYAMAVKDSQGGQCYFFLSLNKTNEVIKFELVESNQSLVKIGNVLFNSILPCPRQFIISMLSKINTKQAYIGVTRSMFMDNEEEIKKSRNILGGDWRVLTNENIVSVRNSLKSDGKTLKPVTGLAQIEDKNEYIFIMMDNYNIPCTLYMAFDNKRDFNLVVRKLSEMENMDKILKNIDPCDEDSFEEYINGRRLLI